MFNLKITSLQNPKIKKALSLYKKNVRDETGLFLIEGYRELLRAVEGNVQIESFFFCPEFFLGENETSLIEKIKTKIKSKSKIKTKIEKRDDTDRDTYNDDNQSEQIYECRKEVFQKLSYRDRPDGLIAVAFQNPLNLQDLKKLLTPSKNSSKEPFLVVAESIEKPGNLGTILRSADGAKVDALILCDERTDLYNPNVVRASVGTLFTLPVISASSSETMKFLKAEKIQITATSPASAQRYTEADLKQSLAVIVGSEQLGLSQRWLKAADLTLKIPMLGAADSLNVASATTLMLYEVLRQRN